MISNDRALRHALDCVRGGAIIGICVAAFDAAFILCVLGADARFEGTYTVDTWRMLITHAIAGSLLGVLGGALVLSAATLGKPRLAAFGRALVPAVWTYVLTVGFLASYGYAIAGADADEKGVAWSVLVAGGIVSALVGWRKYRKAQKPGSFEPFAAATVRTNAVIVAVALASTGVWADGRGRDAFIDQAMQGLDATHEAAPERPNILFVTIDTLRADHLGTYGYTGVKTPEIDKFAASGIVFEQMVAQSSWTRSSFGSMWTSRTPSFHGANWKLKKAERWDGRNETLFSEGLNADLPTFAELLDEAGYRTVGINTNIQTAAMFGFDKGFDNFIDFSRPVSVVERSLFCHGLRAHWHKACDSVTSKDSEYEYQPGDRVLEVATRAAADLADDSGPFFLWVHFMDVHGPYKPHTSDREPINEDMVEEWLDVENPDLDYVRNTLVAAYDEEVAYVDQQVGKLFEMFDSTSGLDNTLIVLSADHGEELMERYRPPAERGEGLSFYYQGYGHGHTMYDEVLRVPLIIRTPDRSLGGTRVPWVAQHIDLLPTFAAAGGVDLPTDAHEFEGMDLLKHVALGTTPPERLARSEMNLYGPEVKALRSDLEKLVVRSQDGGEELYDLLADPREKRSTAKTRFATGALLREQFDRWVASTPELPSSDADVAGEGEGKSAHSPEVEERLKALGYIE
jgi:arylsulfatase A-like enzyme